MCEWRSELNPDYHCRVSPEPGSDYCIFHEPGEKDIGRFEQKFYEQLDGKGLEEARNPRYDFRGYFFPTGILASGGSREAGQLIVPKEIAGDFIGSEATIKGRADFEDATIEGDADFGKATIEGDANFWGATIEGFANFWDATVKGDANFQDATIEGFAYFGDARIEGDAYFLDATIKGDAYFRGTRLRRTVYFGGASIGGKTEFALCQAGALWLGDRRPTILLWWVRWRCGIRLHDVETSGSFWSFARLTFERQGEREKADAAHYLERLVRVSPRRVPFAGRWWNRVYQTLRRSRIVLFPWFFDCLFLRWPTAYGASLLRLFVTWAVIIGGFAGVYTKLILKGFSVLEAPGVLGLGQAITSFWGALYFSVITFTTLGYGDIRPTAGLPSGLAAAEAVLGGIMMALTVLVIGRKFMR